MATTTTNAWIDSLHRAGRLIAHRGGAHAAPENTLPAFSAAAHRGYRWVECDVACTADGVPVLFHDDTLERTSNGTGDLAATSWQELQRLDAGGWFAPRFAGTRIPSLDQALDHWANLGQHACIELKVGAGQDPQRLGSIVAKAVRRRNAGHILISFSSSALIAARNTAPELPRGLILDAPWPMDWLDQVRSVDASALDPDQNLLDAQRIHDIQRAGLAALCWTVNTTARVTELLNWGIDGVTTDAIDDVRPMHAS